MPGKVADVILIIALLALPMLGIVQACGNNGPVNPGVGPEAHNKAPTAVLRVTGSFEGPTPFTVSLDGSGSTDPNDSFLIHEWHFSDGAMLTGETVVHEFTQSGRYTVTLIVKDEYGATDETAPVNLFAWGLADSAWPKYAHDERNSGATENSGPMMDLEHAEEGGAWARYWRGGVQNNIIRGICIGYDGNVFYAQGEWLRARTADGATLWDWLAESTISAWPAVLHDGSVVIATENGWVHRISEDGALIWSSSISAISGNNVILDSAINMSSDGTIYVGGYLYPDAADIEVRGRLAALNLDGGIMWLRVIPHALIDISPEYNSPASLIPAILPSGNVVINGHGGRIFTPDGTLMAKLYYPPGDPVEAESFGPPSIAEDGKIIFTNRYWPQYTANGNYLQAIADTAPWVDLELYDYTGRDQAAVHGPGSIDVLRMDMDSMDLWIVSRTDESKFLGITRQLNTGMWGPPQGTGATVDGNGRTYASCMGLHTFSPIYNFSVYPYVHRHSLWSYLRPSNRMTPPVIGENGWLYVGYGTDIMAVGD